MLVLKYVGVVKYRDKLVLEDSSGSLLRLYPWALKELIREGEITVSNSEMLPNLDSYAEAPYPSTSGNKTQRKRGNYDRSTVVINRDLIRAIDCDKNLSFKVVKSLDKYRIRSQALGYKVLEFSKSINAAFGGNDVIVVTQLKPRVSDAEHLFSGTHFTGIDLRGVDTSCVTTMKNMFYKCKNLVALDFSELNTSNVTDMSGVFRECSIRHLDISSFDTSSVTDMSGMFNGCDVEHLDVSNFDTSNVVCMNDMFRYCENLVELDLSSFNTEKVTDMSRMFLCASRLKKINLGSFDTSNTSRMTEMFFNCSSLTELDLSSFNTGNVTHMSNMFRYCESLTTLDVRNFRLREDTKRSGTLRCDTDGGITVYAEDAWVVKRGCESGMRIVQPSMENAVC